MVWRRLKYPRYKLAPLRPPGTGAFFDFADAAAKRHTGKLKSCSLVRRWGKIPRAASG